MPRQNVIQTNFTAGEVSPLLRGRVDANKYANGAEVIENFTVKPQGAAVRRTGTRSVLETTESGYTLVAPNGEANAGVVRLIPFENTDATGGYILEVGEYYFRIIKNGERILDSTKLSTLSTAVSSNGGLYQLTVTASALSGSITSASGYSSGGVDGIIITTSAPHRLTTGCRVSTSGNGMSAANVTGNKIVRVSETEFVLVGVTAGSPSGVSGGGGTYSSNGLRVGDFFYVTETVSSSLGEVLASGQRLVVHDNPTNTTVVVANIPYSGALGSFSGTVKLSGVPVHITTPYPLDDLLNYEQSADVMYLFHPDYAPRRIYRKGDSTWGIETTTFTDGPYLDIQSWGLNRDATMGNTLTSVYWKITGYTHTATIVSDSNFAAASADNNKFVEWQEDGDWRLGKIVSYTNATATVTVFDNILQHLPPTTKLEARRSRHAERIAKATAAAAAMPRNQQNQRGRTRGSVPHYSAVTPETPDTTPYTSSFIQASNSGSFTNEDVGKYIRFRKSPTAATVNYEWDIIQSIVPDSAGTKANLYKVTANTGRTLVSPTVSTVNTCSSWATRVNRLSAHTRTCTIQALNAGSAYNMFSSADIGRKVRFGFSGRWVWGTITALGSGTVDDTVTVSLAEDMPLDTQSSAATVSTATSPATVTPVVANNGETYDWRLGAWGDVGTETVTGPGYPSTGAFHEQRLCMARTYTQPQTVWMSTSSDFHNMGPTELDSTVLDDSAITVTMSSSKVNPIKWMQTGPVLLVGTTGGEWQIKSGATQSEPITPSNILVQPQTSHGTSTTVKPMRVGASVMFVNRTGTKVRELSYDYTIDSFQARDLTVGSSHMLSRGGYATRAHYQQEKESMMWFLLNDGTMSCCTIDKAQEVIAWHHHALGHHPLGTASVEGIAMASSSDGTYDQLWLVVRRNSGGGAVDRSFIEYLDCDYSAEDGATATKRGEFLDGAVVITNTQSTTVGGVSATAGDSLTWIGVKNDGTVESGTANTGSTITVTSANYATLTVGFNYTSQIKTLPPEGGSQFGSSVGKTKRISDVDIRCRGAYSVWYGWDDDYIDLFSKTLSDGTWFTGTQRVLPNNPYDPESQLTIEVREPYPLELLSVTMTIETTE